MTLSKTGISEEEGGKGFLKGDYPKMLGVVLLDTLAAHALEVVDRQLSYPIHTANIVMPYLLGVVWCALKYERLPAIWAVILNMVSLIIFYIRPFIVTKPNDFDYALLLVVFSVVAFMINELSFKARQQTRELAETSAQFDRERMKNTLLRSVSHDLRNPLATIMGAASSLLDATKHEGSSSKEDLIELAESICHESDRLNRQVSNLIEMTSLESSALVVNKDWNEIEEILGNALTALDHTLGDTEVELQVASDLSLVFVDGLLLEKVFINLIENAVKYSPKHRIRIAVTRGDDKIEVEVFNDGSPIRAGEETRIFEKFYRGEARNTDGAGLGLAICHSIVHLHDGKIWAVPGLKTGVSIRFILPIPENVPELTTTD